MTPKSLASQTDDRGVPACIHPKVHAGPAAWINPASFHERPLVQPINQSFIHYAYSTGMIAYPTYDGSSDAYIHLFFEDGNNHSCEQFFDLTKWKQVRPHARDERARLAYVF